VHYSPRPIHVYPTSLRTYQAAVQLILHPKSAVGGIVQRPASRVSGIVSGNASTPFTPNLINLARDADIVAGDTVLTSGFGSIYPKGIVIGVVEKVANAEGGLLKYAVIAPTVDFSRLEEVMLIVNAANYAEMEETAERTVAKR
jgi:rod shape-determining protein MreC